MARPGRAACGGRLPCACPPPRGESLAPASHVLWCVERVRRGGNARICAGIHVGVGDRTLVASTIGAYRQAGSRAPPRTLILEPPGQRWPARARPGQQIAVDHRSEVCERRAGDARGGRSCGHRKCWIDKIKIHYIARRPARASDRSA
jgi:hypothetical protein